MVADTQLMAPIGAPLDDVEAITPPFEQFGSALDQAHALAERYLSSLPHRPVSRAATAEEMAARFDEPLPDQSTRPDEAVAEWFARAEPGIVATSGPRFFGWMIGGTTPAALAGDWLSKAIDQNTGGWTASPAGVQTEITALRWLKELFDLPRSWAGTITTGGSMSNLIGLAAARQWASLRLGFDAARDGLAGHPAIPVISSTEIHASAVKGLGVLGIGRGSVRQVRAYSGSVDIDALADALAETDGPVIVIANAGEVNTGAFDDLEAIADLCDAHPGGAWLHVDGAFGLFAAASPLSADLARGIERADSVAADAHKWLNVPYESGFVFVRDADALRAAFTVAAAYIAPQESVAWDPVAQAHGPELSRRARGVAIWCALKALGRPGVQGIIERGLAHTRALADWVYLTPGLELVAAAPLNIVCFRYTPAGVDPEEMDVFNQQAVRALQADGRVFVTGTVWNNQHVIRVAFDNWATGSRDVEILREAILDIGHQLEREFRP
jgi:glutamate/tyrosine decarboxylase-like PLP-dependent enzyme